VDKELDGQETYLGRALCASPLPVTLARMKCDDCKVEVATLHITRTVEDEQFGVDLCEACGEKHGYDGRPASISTVLNSTKALHKRREERGS